MKATIGIALALLCCHCGDDPEVIPEFSPPSASGTISVDASVDTAKFKTLELRLVGEGLVINESADLATSSFPHSYSLVKSFWGCKCDTCWQVHAWLSASPSAGNEPLSDEPQASRSLEDACTDGGNGRSFSGLDLTLK